MNKVNCYLLLLLLFASCSDHSNTGSNTVILEKPLAEKNKSLSKEFRNGDVKIKAVLNGEIISFEISQGSKKTSLRGINEIGKITFSNSLPFVSYNGDDVTNSGYLFHRNEFALLPFEDWNGNRIIYKIPLQPNKKNDSIRALVILKERYCLFNQRTSTLVTYDISDKEYLISDQSYFLTNIKLFHLATYMFDEVDFCTQKELSISEESSPEELKKNLLSAMKAFYTPEVYNAYFK